MLHSVLKGCWQCILWKKFLRKNKNVKASPKGGAFFDKNKRVHIMDIDVWYNFEKLRCRKRLDINLSEVCDGTSENTGGR